MEALPPPLVRRDTQPRHIGSRADQLRDLLVHSEPWYQVRHPILVRQGGVAEGEQQQARVALGVACVLQLVDFKLGFVEHLRGQE